MNYPFKGVIVSALCFGNKLKCRTDLCVSEMMQIKMQRPCNYKEFGILIIDIEDYSLLDYLTSYAMHMSFLQYFYI